MKSEHHDEGALGDRDRSRPVLDTVGGRSQRLEPLERTHPAIQYSRQSKDPIAVVQQDGRTLAGLTSEGRSGHLRSVLQALKIPVSSQIMVFSQGSVQSRLIAAGNPRALYFNDSVVVGWVRGGFIEIAHGSRARHGVHKLNTSWTGSASVSRSDECLSCHDTSRTGGVPGMIEPMGHTRPLERRWGGWYVTGNLGSVEHFGNVDVAVLTAAAAPPKTIALASLERTFDTRGYLTPYSDIAALMVFEHQMQMMNLLTRVGWETRIAQRDGRFQSGSAIRERVEQVVDYMLFVDEAPIAAKMQGTSGFAEAFSARGPSDGKGRSLRQLDLQTRLFRYVQLHDHSPIRWAPAEAARDLPATVEILAGKEADARYRVCPPRIGGRSSRSFATKDDSRKYFGG
jgi:hypothetical protein